MHDRADILCPICPGSDVHSVMHDRSNRGRAGRIGRVRTTDEALLDARARVLADLTATGAADARTVSLLEHAVAERRWWADEWPEGTAFVAGQVAQDVQDALFDDGIARWPLCWMCGPHSKEHELRINPELGADPHWVCEESGQDMGRLGDLSPAR